jgi:ketosteroid isomerase-like protein
MHRFVTLILLAVLTGLPARLLAEGATPNAAIRLALAQWTDDFNAGHSETVCDLFAPDLRADVRSAPPRDFETQCRLLRNALADPERSYTVAFELKEIVVDRDIAVVRLTWTNTALVKSTAQVSVTKDEGLDIFRHSGDGSWHIVRYMAYELP